MLFSGGVYATTVFVALSAVIASDVWAVAQSPRAPGHRAERDLNGSRAHTARKLESDDRSLRMIQQHAESINQQGFDLARRGALYSAQAEFIRTLEMVGRARDELNGTNRNHDAIVSALTALEEVDDFQISPTNASRGLTIAETIGKHQTIALKNRDLSKLTSVTATRTYCAFAQDRLLRGCGKVPAASRALYGLGNIELAIAREPGNTSKLGSPKAMAMFEAALRIDPKNHKAANALGILLTRYGQSRLAIRILQRSVRSYPTENGWRSLSECHEALGESRLAKQAMAQCESMRQQKRPGQTSVPSTGINIRWVDQATFVADSPPDMTAADPKESKTPDAQSPSKVADKRQQADKASDSKTDSPERASTPTGFDRIKSGLKAILR